MKRHQNLFESLKNKRRANSTRQLMNLKAITERSLITLGR